MLLTTGDMTVLLVARVIQGIATGAAMTTLGATLVDLNPVHSPGRTGLVNVFAGFAGASVGLRSTALVYGLGVVTLELTALVAQRMRSNRRVRGAVGRV